MESNGVGWIALHFEADHERFTSGGAGCALLVAERAHFRIAQPRTFAVRLIFWIDINRRRHEIAVCQAFRQQFVGQFAMQIEALRLAVELIPTQGQPVEAVEDGIERRLRVAVDIGIVDAQHHGPFLLARE